MRKKIHTFAASIFLTDLPSILKDFYSVCSAVLLIFTTSVISASCSMEEIFAGNTEEVCFTLPVWPPDDISGYPELFAWKITEASAENIAEYICPPETKEIKIYAERNKAFSVSAAPVTLLPDYCKTLFFNPAAAIYPFDFDSKNCSLKWENGFCSQLFIQLVKNSIVLEKSSACIINAFNWKKLQENIDSKISQSIQNFEESPSDASFYNPWQLSSQSILQSVSVAQFDSTLLNTTWIYSFSASDIFKGEEYPELLSSFIPENQILRKYKTFTLKKNMNKYFYASDGILVTLTATSSKKVLQAFACMPIYIEEL